MTRILHELVAAYPHLATLESVGKSYEGRELWLVTLTNQATGPALEKPAYWIDGNTHAGEVTGSTVVLYTIWLYLSQYGQDAKVTREVDRHAIYLLPRISVDGAEKYLTTPYWLRSSTRLYPYVEERDGLAPADLDGRSRKSVTSKGALTRSPSCGIPLPPPTIAPISNGSSAARMGRSLISLCALSELARSDEASF